MAPSLLNNGAALKALFLQKGASESAATHLTSNMKISTIVKMAKLSSVGWEYTKKKLEDPGKVLIRGTPAVPASGRGRTAVAAVAAVPDRWEEMRVELDPVFLEDLEVDFRF